MGALNGNPSTYSSTGAGSSRGTSQRSVGGSTTHSSESDSAIIAMSDWDSGPHREMAVDVPESFVGRTKTPPRYPPPKQHPQPVPPAVAVATTTVINVSSGNVSPGLRKKVTVAQASMAAASANGVAPVTAPNKTSPPPRAPAAPVAATASDVKAQVEAPNAEQRERIRKYQVSSGTNQIS